MKSYLAFAVLVTLSASASAQCVGTGSFKTCFDSSGNSYIVNQTNGTTFVSGSNQNGTWSSSSTKIGSSVFQSGTSINGGSWNQNIYSYPGGSSVFGTDSDGDSVNSVCNGFGCY